VIVAFLKDLSWTVVVLFCLILAACCFLAVLWSRREWQSRKIRVGMFLEREYGQAPEEMEPGVPPPTPPPPPADEAPTKELRKDDAW
jgi:hypothetical protein